MGCWLVSGDLSWIHKHSHQRPALDIWSMIKPLIDTSRATVRSVEDIENPMGSRPPPSYTLGYAFVGKKPPNLLLSTSDFGTHVEKKQKYIPPTLWLTDGKKHHTALYPPLDPPPWTVSTTFLDQSLNRYGMSRIVSPCGRRSQPRAP